jgi:3-phenylpropionate/trans-cinnamate dioxygenase ferredoxin reductase subunit
MRIVIVGGGVAAAAAAEELRARGHEGEIDIFGVEPHLPYNRPPLSKGLLLGAEEPDSIFVHDAQWYADQSISLHLGEPVSGLDLDRRQVLVGPATHRFDRLLLATGSRPRRLDAADKAGPVAYLRTLEDSLAMREALGPDQHVVVVGGGWIGLEVAAAARTARSSVTVIEALELPLVRVLGPEIAMAFAALHRAHGVDLRLSTAITSFTRTEAGQSVVELDDGSHVTADLVVVGIGVEPNDKLARAAGLAVDNGVLVDAQLRTSDPHVFAVGDIAAHQHPVLGRQIRVEHWDTAIEQARVAARNMLGGGEDYTRLPYFFTDQYDLGMEYVGSLGPDGYDDVVLRGDPPGQFTAVWVRDGRVEAGMHVNDWDAIDPIRRLVGSAVSLDGLRDESVDLAALAP